MKSRRLFVLLAVLIFVLHGIATFYAVMAFNTDHPMAVRFGESFALALCSLPLLHLTVFNSAIVAIVLAAMFTYFPWRVAVATLVVFSILLVGGMIGTAEYLDWRTVREWADLAPRPIAPALHGTLAIKMPPSPAVGAYVNSEAQSASMIPAPQAVDWYLVANRSNIDALRRATPNTPGAIDRFWLHRVLLADALQTHAVDEIEAARRIGETFLHEPYLGEASLAISAARQRIVISRKIGAAGEAIGFDPHQQLIDAIHAQSDLMRAMPSPWYAWPYARLCKAETAHEVLQQARIIHNLRGHSFDMPKEEDRRPVVPWNPLGALGNGRRLAWRANDLVSLAAPMSK